MGSANALLMLAMTSRPFLFLKQIMPKTIWQPTSIYASKWTRKMLLAQKILELSVQAVSWNKFAKLSWSLIVQVKIVRILLGFLTKPFRLSNIWSRSSMVTGNLDADDSLCDRDIDGRRSNRPECIIYATVLLVYKSVCSSWIMGGAVFVGSQELTF